MKRVLLFTAKWPSVKMDTDGGSIMITHLIDLLKDQCSLDGLFLREKTEEKIEGMNQIEFLDGSFLTYDTYQCKNENKFISRIHNVDRMADKIASVIDDYDHVIIIHCLQAMGLSRLSEKQRKKVILFPMFLSDSYLRSGDLVPEAYREEERKALHAVGRIITPSYVECRDMVRNYQVDENKIEIIPRAIAAPFFSDQAKKHPGDPIRLIYTASFKNQKNNIEAVHLARLLKESGLIFELHLAGSIQDKGMYQQCLDAISEYGLEEQVILHDTMSQQNLAQMVKQMDVNLSVSRWETFGRGIFEGIAASLPTVILKNIACVSDYVGEHGGVVYVNDVEEMKEAICRLAQNPDYYEQISQDTMTSKYRFTIELQQESLLRAILQGEQDA